MILYLCANVTVCDSWNPFCCFNKIVLQCSYFAISNKILQFHDQIIDHISSSQRPRKIIGFPAGNKQTISDLRLTLLSTTDIFRIKATIFEFVFNLSLPMF